MPQNPSAPVKIGVVGLGRFGRLHALTLARVAEAELVGLVARRQNSLDRLSAEHRIVVVPEFDLDGLCRGNHILNTAAYPIEAWTAVGGYNPNMTLLFEDWDFWIGCVERGFLPRRVPGVFLSYRIRPGSRNDRTATQRREMTTRLRANHPALFTVRQRVVRRVKRIPLNLDREFKRLLARASGGRVTPPPERW